MELNQPITLAINTTVNNSDPGAKEFEEKLEKEIDSLVKTKEKLTFS